MQLAGAGVFRGRWTAEIHEEWMRNVLEERPDIKREALERTRYLMDRFVRDCLVEGYEYLIPSLTLPDPDDRHVLAAAIVAGAEVIVTFNLKDFPDKALSPYGLEAMHPDEFALDALNLAPDIVRQAVKAVISRLKNPPLDRTPYLENLAHCGLPEFANRMKDFE